MRGEHGENGREHAPDEALVPGGTPPRGRRRRRVATVAIAAAVVLGSAGAVGAATASFGADLRAGTHLVPGTTIASVAVGGVSPDDAVAAVEAHVEEVLDRTVDIVHGEHRYPVTARELGADADVEGAVATAVASASDLGFVDLVRLRWLGDTEGIAADVPIDLPDGEVDALVADLADELDRDPIDAEVAWIDTRVERTGDSRDGRTLDRDATAAALAAALLDDRDGDEVAIVFERRDPAVDDARADEIATEVTARADAVLDRAVTVSLAGRDHTVTARELDATADVSGAIDAALTDGATATPVSTADADGITFTVGDQAMGALLDRVSEGTAVTATSAELDLSGGGFRVTPEQVGAYLDRDAAAGEIRSALSGDADAVALELSTVRPTLVASDFDQVLVVRQSDRTVDLVRNGSSVKQWPVAIGTGGSPTPTGTFVVGAMRREPTWVNPAPDRWGADMPARIGPGPDNPLGLRAINWNTLAGSDTLIRFHGTPNEASIGSASSNGCVRMFNTDVVELFEMVGTGTPVVSVA